MTNMARVGIHATTIASDGTHTIVTYHSTQVVRFNRHEIILNSGGYDTATTKTRLNQTALQFDLPYHVYQRNFTWYVDLIWNHKRIARAIPFRDGMRITLDAAGYPTNVTHHGESLS